MLKHIIILPDGTELCSGSGVKNAIMGVKCTESVNVGEELTLGSAFANIMEASILTPAGGLSLKAGDEVVLYKVDDAGIRTQKGVYILEKPTRPTANMIKLTGYDRMIKLDKDLTEWLQSLDDWPYSLINFAKMVCKACGLTLANTSIPNSDFLVYPFSKSGVTGRQLMRWIGEICCRFCRSNAGGEIELAWYESSGKTIAPSGNYRYFAKSLSYDTYQVAPIDAVKIRLSDSRSGASWPDTAADNPYIISGNAILLARVTEYLLPFLDVIAGELAGLTYTPCKVSIPATLDIHVGHTVNITDVNGVNFTALVMTKTTSGQRDTLECTGSYRRDSSMSVNNKTEAEKEADREAYANSAAQDAVKNQTQADIFNKLTNNGQIQGIFYQDGKWYINCAVAQVYNMNAENLTAGKVLAARIDVDGLFAEDITVSGSFTQSATVFFEPGQADLDALYQLISSSGSYTEEQISLYDFDGDGTITLADYLIAYNAMVGNTSLAEWSGAVKSDAKVTIDLKNPRKAIRVTGTNMWGRVVEKCFGLNMVFADGNVEDTFNTILEQSAAFKELKAKVDALSS